MQETDAQKKEIVESQDPLQDLTPQKDATGSTQNAGPTPDAQKKEITDV